MAGLTGLPEDLIGRLDDNSLLEHLRSPDGSLDTARLLVIADLTREEGEIYRLRGLPAQAGASYLRALRYYLEVALAPEDELSDEEAEEAGDERAVSTGAFAAGLALDEDEPGLDDEHAGNDLAQETAGLDLESGELVVGMDDLATNTPDLAKKIAATASRLDLPALPEEVLFNLYVFWEQNGDYAKALHALTLLQNILPGDEGLRQERQEFRQRLLALSETELTAGGLTPEEVQAWKI
jgi:hypothetical protein